MRRLSASVPVLLVTFFTACRCARKSSSEIGLPVVVHPEAAGSSLEIGVVAKTEPMFSLPIASVRVDGTSVVAGLVAAAGVIRVVGLRDGRAAWSRDAISEARFALDAELTILPAAHGSALLWRAGSGARGAGTLVLLGPSGELLGAPIEVGSGVCSTKSGLAWLEPHPHGKVRVFARTWAENSPRNVTILAPDRAPTLVCGDETVFVLGEGDDDLTVETFVAGDSVARHFVAIRDDDFRDEEREHEALPVGDDLEIVRVGAQGAVATRDVPRGGPPSPWHTLKYVLPADDDVVAIDADNTATWMVLTHEVEDVCPPAGVVGQRVQGLRMDRKSGAESVLNLATPSCEGSSGPFWVGTSNSAVGGPLIAWVERSTKPKGDKAPIDGLVYRAARADGLLQGRIDILADALLDGGCDESGCFAAALVRGPDGDSLQPMPIVVIGIPPGLK
jgi:hypothetical protein